MLLKKVQIINTLLFMVLYGIYAAPKLKSGYQLSIIATGLNPTTMAVAQDGRVFVCEKHGSLRVIQNDTLLETPALTLQVDNYNERGLIGIALDPNFLTNHFVYLHYTPKTTPPRVSRFVVPDNIADIGSETVLYEMDPLEVAGVHNGGALAFDAQGYLYIATGNIGVNEHSQSLQSTWGKILRINADGSIPNDNPFYNNVDGKYKAIWAYGLRNPFTMTADPTSNKLYINDVGEASWEEINVGQKGANYGWPMFEGLADTTDPTIVQPVFTYFHQNSSCSITGGSFYSHLTSTSRKRVAIQFPSEYSGKFFFGDYCAGWVRAVDLTKEYDPITTMDDNQIFISGLEAALGVVTGPDGSLYVLDRGNSNGSIVVNTEVDTGILYKIVRTTDLGPSVFLQPESKLVSVNYSATFTVGVNGDDLSYQWYRNGEPISDSNSNTITITNAQLSDNATKIYARIFNSYGDTTSDTAYLYVTTRLPPTLEIISPTSSDKYSAGDTFFFKGSVSSSEDPDVKVAWTVVLHHQEHTHPFLGPIPDVTEGNFTIPVVGEVDHVQWYRVHFNAEDSLGLSAETFVDIHPNLGTVHILSDTAGVVLELDGISITPPMDLIGVVGMKRTLAASSSQVVNNARVTFDYWSTRASGGSIDLPITSEEYTITAYYSAELLNTAAGIEMSAFLTLMLMALAINL